MTESWIEIRHIETSGLSRAEARKAQSEAWRRIVRERLGSDIEISVNDKGAPLIGRKSHTGQAEACESPVGYIGVSHTKDRVAVVWSPAPCAVDIEPKERKIAPAVSARMGLTPGIRAWCAYEALYKYKSVTGVELPESAVRFHPHPELIVAIIGYI